MQTALKAVLGILILGVSLDPAAAGRPGPEGKRVGDPTVSGPRIDPNFGRMPLYFISNRGQLDPRVDYYVAGADKTIYFGPSGITIALTQSDARKKAHESNKEKGESTLDGRGESTRWTVKLDFVGADPGVRPAGEGKAEAIVSYFKGKPDEWRPGLATYSRIVYKDLWPGIDLAFYGTAERLKHEFIVHPGADPSVIRLAYRGASDVILNREGQLQVDTPLGGFRDEAPTAYQEKARRRIAVPIAFRLGENVPVSGREIQGASDPISRTSSYGFVIGDYDHSLPLVLDPATVIYCGFIGGALDDRATGVAIDSSGNAYVVGWTGSFDFPVAVGPDLGFNSAIQGTDAFVAKVNPAGTGLVYCGYIGGSWDDVATGIAVDGSGNAYVSGWTYSMDFPALVGPGLTPHANISQYSEAFVAKVNASGTGLAYSGFIGGSLGDQAAGIAVDGSGNAYVTGSTESDDFPTTVGPGLTFNGATDAFVVKVAASGTGLVYSGYIGGLGSDYGKGIAVDSSGNAYVTGYTNSYPTEHFPVKVGPSLTYSYGDDAFVAKVNAAGTGLVYCGYIGGTGDDHGAAIAVDPSGNAYVTGDTNSLSQFPVMGGPDLVYNGGQDAFVAKVNATGTSLLYCGYIGGTGDDIGTAISVDQSGNAYVAGQTMSGTGFPVIGGPSLVNAGMADAFLATVDPSGSRLIYCGYLGGSQNDGAGGIAADGTGNVYATGYTRSNDFPVIVGPSLAPSGGSLMISDDAFIARIFEKLPPAAPTDVHATAVTSSEIDLAWTDASANEDGFKIERKTGAGGTWSQIGTVGANITTYKNGGLVEGTTYFYRVRAYNDIGDSAYSNEAGVAILTRPAGPTNLTATAVNERRVNLAWADNSSAESGFRIERKTNAAATWTAIGTVAANVTAYADTQVVEDTTYTYRILAFNSGGDSAPSNEASVTTPDLTIPTAPSGLQATALSATQARLAWIDNSYNEAGFKVERKTGAGGAWAQVGTAAADATSWTDTGLAETTTYYFRVLAYDNAGDSGYSNEAPVTTPAYQPLLRLPIPDIAFGTVNECATLDRTTIFFNDGGAPLTITAVTFASGSADFAYRGPATPFTVPPLGSQTVTVRFGPTATGALSAVFAVQSNDPGAAGATFGVSGTGFIPSITLALQVQRLVERAWIIRREYGKIDLTVTKSVPFNVTTYRLSRKTGTGAYVALKDFTEADLPAGRLTYLDMFLAGDASYSYKVDALDCGGRVIATSSEAGAVSPAARPVTRPERKIVKR
jgi:hypothetical protein